MIDISKDSPLTMITVYDYPTALAFDECGFDFFLVGDSVGMVELGLKDTKSVTLDMVIHHLQAVKKTDAHPQAFSFPASIGALGNITVLYNNIN